MLKPTIHLNGTSSQELSRQLEKVYVACNDLIDALSNARPHGRDYYPQGDSALNEATKEHEARIDVDLLWPGVDEGGDLCAGLIHRSKRPASECVIGGAGIGENAVHGEVLPHLFGDRGGDRGRSGVVEINGRWHAASITPSTVHLFARGSMAAFPSSNDTDRRNMMSAWRTPAACVFEGRIRPSCSGTWCGAANNEQQPPPREPCQWQGALEL